jgi:hypothetical protein
MAAKRVMRVSLGQQRGELLEDGLDDVCAANPAILDQRLFSLLVYRRQKTGKGLITTHERTRSGDNRRQR